MKFYDAFCGIGGFHLGITQAHPDWECSGACDIDKHAKQIYSKHFPEVKLDDDIRKMDGLPAGTEMFCGGFPCQSFSIAGKRGGFNDTRGTLFFEIARLLKSSKPKWVFLENVKGLLNHDEGRTFSTILNTLGELGYWWEYQVLNSKNFGVPQNRERVFIVGHLAGERSGAVFPLGTDAGPPDKQGPAGGKKQVAQAITARDFSAWKGNYLQTPEIAGCLTGGGHSGGMHSDMTVVQVNNPSHAGDRVYSSDGLAPAVRARARQDQYASAKIISHAPRCGDPKKGGTGLLISDQHSFTIDSSPHYVAERRGGKEKNDMALAPSKSHRTGNVVEQRFTTGGFNTLTTGEGCGNKSTQNFVLKESVVPVLTPEREEKRQQGRRFKEDGDPAFALTSQDIHRVLLGGARIRRLTEVECERLQGFPDGWTEGISATQRYKCLGNAVTTNVIRAIAERIQ